MRPRGLAGLVTAVTVVVGAGLPIQAAFADVTTLYVNNAAGAGCSDAGSGTQVQPYCTVQAAANVVQPGQTVQVAPGDYPEQVTVSRSGSAGMPITFSASENYHATHRYAAVGLTRIAQPRTLSAHGFILDGVHDVKITGFAILATGEGVLVKRAKQVVLDGNFFPGAADAYVNSAAVRLTAGSVSTTVSRNQFLRTSTGGAVVVDQGAQGSVLTTNSAVEAKASPFQVVDAPQTAVTSNTSLLSCGPAIVLTGASAGSWIENNVIGSMEQTIAPGPCRALGVSVSAGSATGTVADYNLVQLTNSTQGFYEWSGTAYQTPAALTAATSQGKHDLIGDPMFGGEDLLAGSPAVDSADENAPGELGTDLVGRKRVKDPLVTGTGTGSSAFDRGAYELSSLLSVSLKATPAYAPFPFKATLTATPSYNWPTTSHYVFDFGDGSAKVVTDSPTVDHIYSSQGQFSPMVTASDDAGGSVTGVNSVHSNAPAPLTPVLKVSPVVGSGKYNYLFDTTGSASPWPIATIHVDFGDGSSVDPGLWQSSVYHSYDSAGPFTVKLTMTDQGGGSQTVTQKLTAGYAPSGYTPITPVRLLDTRETHSRVPGGGTASVNFGSTMMGCSGPGSAVPTGATAVVLNVTAVDPASAGFFQVSSTQDPNPPTSNLNFIAGQNTANLVTVPLDSRGNLCSSVEIRNVGGSADVVVDIEGYYAIGAENRFTAVTPSRLLDTRDGVGTKLGNDSELSVKVAGQSGVSADAAAVVLNVTSTEADKDSFLTLYPSGTARPWVSNLNFRAGQTVPNQVVVPVGPDGKVTVYNRFGNTHVVVDVFGYYSKTGDSLFTPVDPQRLVDTRGGSAAGKLNPGSEVTVSSLPANATGALLNVTATEPTDYGFLTVAPAGISRPGTSNLNFRPGQTVANHVTTPVSQDGSFDVWNAQGRTHVVVDLFGYFSKP